ncbi:MAG: hypothetical protein NTV36_02155, partial [Candidatus Staskawiczbacteria bacterium]|nr:hypothetical protein [Candidatus Staskawiczbacteria bacterium]
MNKKIFLFWIISVILILIFIILGGFWFYDGYLLKNNTGAFKSRPEVSKLTESPEKKEILKKDNLYSIKNKAQDEILFAKAQMSKAEQIFQEIKNIDEEISLKFGGYDGMHESRVITPSEYIISKKGQAEVSADKIFLAESENPSTKNSAFAYLSIP